MTRWEQIPHGWPRPDPDRVAELVRAVRWCAEDGIGPLAAQWSCAVLPPALATVLWPTERSPGPVDVACAAAAGIVIPAASAIAYLGPTTLRLARGLSPSATLQLATGADLLAMEQLLFAVQDALGRGPMDPLERDAAAHLLCARIRPHLFAPTAPAPRDPQQWWVNLRAALNEPGTLAHLAAAQQVLLGPAHPDSDVRTLSWAAGERQQVPSP